MKRAFLLLFLSLYSCTTSSAPTFRGKTVHEWVELHKNGASSSTMNQLKTMKLSEFETLLPEIQEMLNSKEKFVRWDIISLLGSIRGDETASKVLDILIQCSHDPELDVRHSAISQISLFNDKAKHLAPLILPFLKDEDSGIRLSAVQTLGSMGADPTLVVPPLIGLIQDPDWIVQSAVLDALAAYAKDAGAAIPVLEQRLQEAKLQPSEREEIEEALRQLREAAK